MSTTKKSFTSSFTPQNKNSFQFNFQPQKTPRGQFPRFNKSYQVDKSLVDTSIGSRILPVQSKIQIPAENRQNQGNIKHIKQKYLTQVLINRAINVRLAIKKMEDIPVTLFKEGTGLDITRALIMKSKINLETSLLRTLFYSFDRQEKQQSTKLHLDRGTNTFILPTKSEQSQDKMNAILLLKDLLKQRTRQFIKKFRQNKLCQEAKERYFSLWCSNYELSRETAFSNFKRLPSKRGIDKNTLILGRMVSISQQSKDKSMMQKMQALNQIKMQSLFIKFQRMNSARLLVTCARIRREQMFLIWKDSSFDCRKKEKKFIEVEEQKFLAVKKIMLRNYLKLFKEISRRVFTCRKVAAKLACSSQINLQKSFWRLHLNSKDEIKQ